ncbi:PLAC8 family-domain-containing protein [Xylariaceae sp. AK1471]|nr:PLAC8 family-domain-containing protein [Xylariaceae sp. AK1471]
MSTPEKYYGGAPQYHPQEQGIYGQSPAPQHQQPYQQQPYQQAPMSANHQVQQHPPVHAHNHAHNLGEKSRWQTDICSCGPCSSCLLAWCLPCILLGQTSERIRDPSMQNTDLLNSDCLIHGAINCFTGCGWIYAMLKRGEIREKYNIEGSGCGDCCVSFWCSCCALIQQDNEVKIREKNAQPVTQGYQSQASMHMPVPQPQPTYHPQ